MAEPRTLTVELSGFLSELPGVAMKGQLSAPIAWRADRLIEALPRKYGKASYPELVSALIHGTEQDPAALSAFVENYREERVWETRHGIERTEQSGLWEITLRPSGGQTG